MYSCATELALLGNLSIKTFNEMGQQVLCDIIKLLTSMQELRTSLVCMVYMLNINTLDIKMVRIQKK